MGQAFLISEDQTFRQDYQLILLAHAAKQLPSAGQNAKLGPAVFGKMLGGDSQFILLLCKQKHPLAAQSQRDVHLPLKLACAGTAAAVGMRSTRCFIHRQQG